MSLSPSKHRTLTRQASSPSLASVGLPPPLPDPGMMTLSSASSSPKKTRSHPIIHRGDVSSSDNSSIQTGDEAEKEVEPGWIMETSAKAESTLSNTPKRRVVGPIETMSGKMVSGMKRDNLTAKLQQVARVKKSKSTGDTLNRSPSMRTSHMPFMIAEVRENIGNAISPAIVGVGNDKVVVCVRMKPTDSPFASSAYDVTSGSLTLSDSHPNVMKRGGKAGRQEEYTYTFDKLLRHPSTTPELYGAKIAPLVEKAMSGFNSTIFAYGQTGSGKSFTMTGVPSELGIIPCAVDGVFDAINAELDRAYLLRISYVEIYNENLRDLLNLKNGPLKDDEKPTIHTARGKVYVAPLVEEVVSSPQDVMDLLEKGNVGRKIGATDWNDRSSRSHCVFTIVIESRPRDGDEDDDIRLSRLNLIDLAGSERAVSDLERRGEGKYINRSLLALREVINKLTDKKRGHIPYRDSKLTHLLENALGGGANICVICTLSAEEEHCAETLETLKFAGRCSQVETKAKKNVLLSDERALIRAKDREIDDLKRRLQGMANEDHYSRAFVLPPVDQFTDLAESVAVMEARKAKLHAQLAKLNGEILTSELPRSFSGMPMSPPNQKRRRISEVLGGPGLAIGAPKRTTVGERRVVSSTLRFKEDENSGSFSTAAVGVTSMAFETDRTLAALRRSLAAKEDELARTHLDLSALLDRLPEIDVIRDQLNESRDSKQVLQATVSQQEIQLRDSHTQLETTRAELVSTINQKASRIDELEETILDLRKLREDSGNENRQRIENLRSQLDHADGELGKASHECGVKQSISDDLATARAQKAAVLAEMDDVRRSHREQILSLTRDVGSLTAQRFEASDAARSAACQMQELKTANNSLRVDLGILRSQRQTTTSTESSLVVELRAELETTKTTTERKEVLAQRGLEAEQAKTKALRDDLKATRQELKTSKAESQTMLEALKKAESDLVEVSADRGRICASLEHQSRETEATEKKLEVAITARGTAELCLATRETELRATRKSHAAAQNELRFSFRAATADRDQAKQLGMEVAELKLERAIVTSTSPTMIAKSRHSASDSVASVHSLIASGHLRAQTLTAASSEAGHSPSMLLCTEETEEIDRLSKIIEEQKMIIGDQKEKIKLWAQELEQQRQTVHSLTSDPPPGTPPKQRLSLRATHGKSTSLSVFDLARDSPTPASAKLSAVFPQTFTARNLALPTSPSTHTPSFSSASAKKGRRVTIEHDIERLGESSKVNQAKAFFDVPAVQNLTPTPTRGNAMTSTPKQRRP